MIHFIPPRNIDGACILRRCLPFIDRVNRFLDKITVTVVERLQRYKLEGRTITLKIKYSDFRTITRSRSFIHPINDSNTIAFTAKQLLVDSDPQDKKIRLLGITLSNFGDVTPKPKNDNGKSQLQLFPR